MPDIHHHYYTGAVIPGDIGAPSGVAAILARFDALEAQMSALTDNAAAITTAVDSLSARIGTFPTQLAELTTALEAERAEANRLAEAEALEDVSQDAALAEARAATDAALSEATTVAGQLGVDAGRINALATDGQPPVAPVDPTTGEPVVGEATDSTVNPAG